MIALLPILLLLLPLIEIAVFILVGSQIGVLATVALVVLAAIVGATLLRRQGLATLTRIRADMDAGDVPGRELVHGVMILAAGLLLLLPGFVTDVIGLLLFLPPVRDLLWAAVGRRVVVITPVRGARSADSQQRRPRRPQQGPVIDLEDGDFHREGDPKSPWNKPSER